MHWEQKETKLEARGETSLRENQRKLEITHT